VPIKPARRKPLVYPKNQIEFEECFSTEKKCLAFLMKAKWPEGFRCAKCGKGKHWLKTRARVVCAACRVETSVLAGTLFTNSKKPLRIWLHALWWITSQKNGISAVGFKNIMGIGSYRTAWSWLHKLRRAMALREKTRLNGSVEVDETFIGGVRSGKRGRGAAGKVLIAVAAEAEGTATGRIRLAIIKDATTRALGSFIRENVDKGSTVITDGWESYNAITTIGYAHQVADDVKNPVPRAHKAMSLLKRWLLGTHQGRIEGKYLQRYLDEFVFRFNRRTSSDRGKLFESLLALGIAGSGESTGAIIREANSVSEPELFPVGKSAFS